jgi:hypothetical protein
MEYFSFEVFGVVLVVPVESDRIPVLVHGVHVLPGVLVLEESVVVAVAVWSWLITVDFSLPEEISVVVAILASLHFLSHTFTSLHRIGES